VFLIRMVFIRIKNAVGARSALLVACDGTQDTACNFNFRIQGR